MKKISEFIYAYLKGRKERKAEQQKAVMQSESLKVVQVMEFQNQLYICYNNIPLIDIRYVENVQSVLNDARQSEKSISKVTTSNLAYNEKDNFEIACPCEL